MFERIVQLMARFLPPSNLVHDINYIYCVEYKVSPKVSTLLLSGICILKCKTFVYTTLVSLRYV